MSKEKKLSMDELTGLIQLEIDGLEIATKMVDPTDPNDAEQRKSLNHQLIGMKQIRRILENIWVEGEPGHEEYHIHPKAFEEEE